MWIKHFAAGKLIFWGQRITDIQEQELRRHCSREPLRRCLLENDIRCFCQTDLLYVPAKTCGLLRGSLSLRPLPQFALLSLTLMSYHMGFVATVPAHPLFGFPEDTWPCKCRHQVLVFLSLYVVSMWAFRDTKKLCFRCCCHFSLTYDFKEYAGCPVAERLWWARAGALRTG